MTLPFGPPVTTISPLIKLSRYFFGILGINRGMARNTKFGHRAEDDRKKAAEEKVKRDKIIAEERRLNAIYEAGQVKKLEKGTLFDDL